MDIEIDSIIGTSEGKNESCLVMTERQTREEIVIKVEDKTADVTTRAMQQLKQTFGDDFNKIFFTITLDNGSEFANQNAFDALGVPRSTAIPDTHTSAAVTKTTTNSCAATFPRVRA